MEYQHKLLLVTIILVAVALYITFTVGPGPSAQNSDEAEALLVKAAAFGKGLSDYTYSYSEISDGYRTSYVLASSGGARYAEIAGLTVVTSAAWPVISSSRSFARLICRSLSNQSSALYPVQKSRKSAISGKPNSRDSFIPTR